jgi:hypothetical protein
MVDEQSQNLQETGCGSRAKAATRPIISMTLLTGILQKLLCADVGDGSIPTADSPSFLELNYPAYTSPLSFLPAADMRHLIEHVADAA